MKTGGEQYATERGKNQRPVIWRCLSIKITRCLIKIKPYSKALGWAQSQLVCPFVP